MTDFFADLERELRRAHRRDSERHPSSRVLDLRRRLPVLPAIGRPALVALAVPAHISSPSHIFTHTDTELLRQLHRAINVRITLEESVPCR
jgi:hypothetical protein